MSPERPTTIAGVSAEDRPPSLRVHHQNRAQRHQQRNDGQKLCKASISSTRPPNEEQESGQWAEGKKNSAEPSKAEPSELVAGHHDTLGHGMAGRNVWKIASE
jgi:hypothetical protein